MATGMLRINNSYQFNCPGSISSCTSLRLWQDGIYRHLWLHLGGFQHDHQVSSENRSQFHTCCTCSLNALWACCTRTLLSAEWNELDSTHTSCLQIKHLFDWCDVVLASTTGQLADVALAQRRLFEVRMADSVPAKSIPCTACEIAQHVRDDTVTGQTVQFSYGQILVCHVVSRHVLHHTMLLLSTFRCIWNPCISMC